MTEDSARNISNHEGEELSLELLPYDAEGIYFYRGDIARLPGAQVVESEYLTTSRIAEISNDVAREYSKINVGLQFLDGLDKASGLVRLAPETLAMLNAGNKVVIGADGMRIGALMNDAGKFSGTVKWMPVSKASTALTGLASASSALTMVMIQMQLASIEKLAIRTLEEAKFIHLEQQWEQWDAIDSAHEFLLSSAQEAVHVGRLTDEKFMQVSSQGVVLQLPALQKTQERRLNALRDKLKTKTTLADRQTWYSENIPSILETAEGVLRAHDALRMYDGFRILHALQSDTEQLPGSEQARTIEHIRAKRDQREIDFQTRVLPVVDEYIRMAQLTLSAPGKQKTLVLNQKKQKRSVAEVKLYADQLSSYLAALFPNASRNLPVASPHANYWLRNESDYRDSLEMYKYLLKRDEYIMGVADVGTVFDIRGRMLVTNERVIVLRTKYFNKNGEISQEFPLSRLGYAQYLGEADADGTQRTLFCLRNPDDMIEFYIDPRTNIEMSFPEWLNVFAKPGIAHLADSPLMLES